jgi:hypothetical protein
MNNEFEHIDLDELLKEKLGNYAENPSPAHWERFERDFLTSPISNRKPKHYRAVVYTASAIAAAVAILFLINRMVPETLKTKTETAQSAQKTATEQPLSNPNRNPALATAPVQPDLKNKVAANITPPARGENQRKPQQTEIPDQLPLTPDTISPDRRGDVRFFTPFSLLNPIAFSSAENQTISTLKISNHSLSGQISPTSAKILKHHTPGFVRQQSFNRSFFANSHVNPKLEAKRNRNSFSKTSALGRFVGKLEYKINVTPQYCSQTLNNKGGVVANEFDPQFYRAIENGMFAFSGGLEVVFPIGPGWSVYSGLKWNEYKRETTNGFSQVKTTNGQMAVPTSAGDVIIHGLINTQLNNNTSFHTKLVLQSAEIPVVARFQAGKYVYLDGGVKYSYIVSGKTQTNLIGSHLPFTYDQISDFKDHHLSLVMGTGLTVVTGSGIKFDAGPEICWNVTNLNPTSNLLNKPLTFGLHVALSLERFRRN